MLHSKVGPTRNRIYRDHPKILRNHHGVIQDQYCSAGPGANILQKRVYYDTMQSLACLRRSLGQKSLRKVANSSSNKTGLRRPSTAYWESVTSPNPTYRVSTRLLATSFIDKRPMEGKFHKTSEADEEFGNELFIDDQSSSHYPEMIDTEATQEKVTRPHRRGPGYVLIGKSETGQFIYRRQDLDYENKPTKMIEELWPSQKKRSMKLYHKVLVELPLKDQDLDFVTAPSDFHDAPFDFSRLSTSSQDIDSLATEVSKKTGLNAVYRKNEMIQAFESVVVNQEVKPMDARLFSIGRELIELHVINALTSTYPNLPSEALIRFTELSTNSSSLSRALLALKLEPFIALVPGVPLSKFSDPSAACLQMAANSYLSLVGLLYQDQGFDKASQFVFDTLHLVRVSPEELMRLKLLDGVKNAKKSLTDLLYKLRFPLPIYQIEHVAHGRAANTEQLPKSSIRYTAIALSGDRIIGRGQSSSKARAEARAAANALLHHWSMQSTL